MWPVFKWLMGDRRRSSSRNRSRSRFVGGGEDVLLADTSAADNTVIDASVGLAVAVSIESSTYCDTSSSVTSFDSGACSAPPDTSSPSF